MKPRALVAMLIASLVLPAGAVPLALAAPRSTIAVDSPATAHQSGLFEVTLHAPPGTAALQGRLLFRAGAADLVGVAALQGGTVLGPEPVANGAAFGAFGLSADGGAPDVTLVVSPLQAGKLHLRVLVDSASNSAGAPINLRLNVLRSVLVSGGSGDIAAPAGGAHSFGGAAPRPTKQLKPDGRFDTADLDTARVDWSQAVASDSGCSSVGDANGDGCTDIADVQATFSSLQVESVSLQDAVTPIDAVPDHTFTVTSVADTPDAAPGNGACADSLGLCTLRAALTEADWLSGLDRITFNLVGTAPVQIQVGSRLPIITSTAGGVIIDGYTQPGSRTNTAASGSNAIPGVLVRGNGESANEYGIYMTSAGNVVRGLALTNFAQEIFVDGANAHDNLIVGNWIGFNRDGTNGDAGRKGVIINTGATHNVVGTPALADRNVIGNADLGIENYGPGTDFNVMQNNLFCIRPNGISTAPCATGIDYNFGPKHSTIGGAGTNERNVFGTTWLQGIELSHGWNPAQPPRVDGSLTWQINDHDIIGNWVGFRADGSYDPAFRSGQNNPGTGDNGQAINVYDGVYDNLVEGNYAAAVYHGITIMAPDAQRNVVRGNTIGRSPLGQEAPLTGWGIRFRWATQFDTIQGNTIANAAMGGIGMVEPDVFNVRISQNIVQATNGPAIDLFGIAGPDPNDPGDGDNGANTLLNTPNITTASTTSIAGTATIPGATVEVFRASRAAGQFGLPSAYLGSATVNGSGNWSVPVALAIGDVVTASQIHPDGNTSELAVNRSVTSGGSPPPNNPPVASFTSSCTALACTFTNTSTDSDGSVTGSSWSFGDGGSSTATSPSHTYAAGGTYTVTLIVTDNVGATGTTNHPVTVQAAANQPPTAGFSSTCDHLACSFTNTSSDADGTIASSAWTFGDGTSSTQTNPSHTYAAASTYTVTLTVTDNGGATGQVSRQVTATAPPPIALSVRGYKVKGYEFVDLTWTGATTSTVGVYRNGTLLVTTANDGAYTDDLNRKGSGTFTYQVCEAGGQQVCSDSLQVVF
jgi:CSLREA domain-containing protein